MKVAIVGHFGLNKDFNDGQTVKTKNIYEQLVKIYGHNEIKIIDTYNWKKNPFKLFWNSFNANRKCENVIILPAINGVKVFIPLFYMLNFFFKKDLHYITIGSWVYSVVSKNRVLINALKRYKGIYVENFRIKDKLEQLNILNVIVMPNFKNIVPIKKNKIKEVKSNDVKLCIFSRIMEEKGVEDAIDCVKHFSSDNESINVVLDMYGPIDSKYEEKFSKIVLSLPSNIKYCGVIPSSESVDIIKKYDLLLFPTRFKTEGIPGTILDAYASGVPVLASKWDNFDEIIDIEKTGIVFEFMNNDDFYDKLTKLLKNPKILMKLKQGALNKYSEYNPSKIIRILTDNMR